jgi:AcrR family transcriptional regulator
MDMLAAEGVSGFTTRKVAEEASTSTPAVYELFGDKSGLVREVFFEGFRMLRRRFEDLAPSDDPRADVVRLFEVFRAFVSENPVLARVMFSRPFADFDPGPAEVEAGATVRQLIVGHVRRCISAKLIEGDATDVAHVLLALAQGLSAQETAGLLGSSKASIDRRWELAIRVALEGLRPARSRAR